MTPVYGSPAARRDLG